MLPAGETPVDLEAIDGMTLDDAAVADVLRHATATPLPGRAELEGDLSLSIAGAQEKTALLHHGNHWLRPLGSTPTTHIFKLPLGRVGNMQADMRTSVETNGCARRSSPRTACRSHRARSAGSMTRKR